MRILSIIIGLSMLCWSGVFAQEPVVWTFTIPASEVSGIVDGQCEAGNYKPTIVLEDGTIVTVNKEKFARRQVGKYLEACAVSKATKDEVKARRKDASAAAKIKYENKIISSGG